MWIGQIYRGPYCRVPLSSVVERVTSTCMRNDEVSRSSRLAGILFFYRRRPPSGNELFLTIAPRYAARGPFFEVSTIEIL
jgi:hypothetical protein